MVKKFSCLNVDYFGELCIILYLYYSDYLFFYMSIGVLFVDFSYFYGSEKYGGFLFYFVYYI